MLKNIHKGYELPAGAGGKSSVLLAYDYGYGDGKHEDTDEAVGVVLRVTGWGSLVEVEDREREIGILLSAPYLRINPGPGGTAYTWPRLDSTSRQGLHHLLKRALYHCDALRDLEGQAVVNVGLPVSAYSFRPQAPKLDATGRDVAVEESGTPAKQRRLRQVTIPNEARHLQIQYLKELPDADIFAIFALTRVAVESWHEFRMLPAHDFGTDFTTLHDRQVAFQETILRQGSYFLYSEVRGFGVRARHRTEMLNDCMDSLDEIELNVDRDLCPSLYTSLRNELRARINVPRRDLERAVLGRVEKLIGAREPAFADPPSRRGHGAAAAADVEELLDELTVAG